MARLFVALVPPAAVREALSALRCPLPGARWTRPEQLHLTLRFLGQVAPAQVAAVAAACAGLRAPAFELRARGVGCFPDPARARILWAGATPPSPVHALRAALDACLDPVLGPDPEAGRGFVPHLTLARTDGRGGPAVAAWLARHRALDGPPWHAAEVVLFESFTRPEGAVHEARARVALPAA